MEAPLAIYDDAGGGWPDGCGLGAMTAQEATRLGAQARLLGLASRSRFQTGELGPTTRRDEERPAWCDDGVLCDLVMAAVPRARGKHSGGSREDLAESLADLGMGQAERQAEQLGRLAFNVFEQLRRRPQGAGDV